MKLIILLAVASLASSDKLDRTYLPPAYAQTSGGSGNFLQTPNFANPPEANNVFTQGGNGLAQSGNGFAQGANDFALNGNGFSQNGNDYAQNGNGFAQNGNDYAQNGNGFAQGGNDFAPKDNGFAKGGNDFSQNTDLQRGERSRAAFERTASILRQDSQNDGETYSYSFETENGITAEESGVATNGVEAQGGFSYTGDDGQVYSIRYTADQNGFVPQGAHLPTAPPVPEEILKALEQNARDEANGIFDDGSYQEGKYADSEAETRNGNYNNNNGNQNYNNDGNQNYNNGNQNYADGNQNFGSNGIDNSFARDDDTVVTNSAAATNAYLPPVANQIPATRNQRPQNNQRPNSANPTNSYLPPFDNQRQAIKNQRPEVGFQRQTVANTAYLPPLDNQRVPAVRNQRPQVNQGNFATPQQNNFGSNGVTNAYLPPRDQSRRPTGFNGQASPQKSSNNGFSASPVSNGFGQRNIQRRPSFNARDGYQY